MKLKNSYLLLLLLSTLMASAQNFSNSVMQLSKELQELETNKSRITQKVQELQPGVLKIEIISTNLKDGKSLLEAYELNMADIDINTIKTFTDKDVIKIQLLAGKKQKVIKKITDNNKTQFEDELYIYAKNIDNGRNLVEIFKSLIPISTEIIEKRLSLKTYQEHINWLLNNIKNVSLQNKQYVQKLTQNAKYPSKLELSIDEVSNSKTSKNSFEFNLANINPNSIFMEVKDDVILINLETKRKLKTIKTFSSLALKDYKNNISIYCDNMELSRDIQKVLKSTIALAENKIDAAIPKISSISQGISLINDYIKTVTVNDIIYSQNITNDCVATITKKEATPTKLTDESYSLNFKDIAKNLIKYDTNGKSVYVEIQTKSSNKYLKYTVNNELKNYTNNLKLEFSAVEDAMISSKILEQIIELCEKKENKIIGSKKEILTQIKNNIKKVDLGNTSFEQSLVIKDDNTILFKSTTIAQKNSKTYLYEFNLKDINPTNLSFNTSGISVYVTLNTNYSEKIIKYYEDGIIKNYQSTFNIQATTIEEARYIYELFKKVLN